MTAKDKFISKILLTTGFGQWWEDEMRKRGITKNSAFSQYIEMQRKYLLHLYEISKKKN